MVSFVPLCLYTFDNIRLIVQRNIADYLKIYIAYWMLLCRCINILVYSICISSLWWDRHIEAFNVSFEDKIFTGLSELDKRFWVDVNKTELKPYLSWDAYKSKPQGKDMLNLSGTNV